MLPSFSEVHAQAQRDRVSFLQTDLALCSAFCDMANTELQVMGDRKAALKAQGNAEKGYLTIKQLLIHIDDSVQKDELERGLNDLRSKLDTLQKRFS